MRFFINAKFYENKFISATTNIVYARGETVTHPTKLLTNQEP